MKYLYAMKLKSFYVEDYPKEGLVKSLYNEDEENTKYKDLLVYNRKLNKYLEEEWKLEYLGAYEDIEWLA